MNDFKGLVKDIATAKTPPDMWMYAKNILLSKKYLSIVNEKGTKLIASVPGVVIGGAVTAEDLVFFSVDGEYSCIGYINKYGNNYVPVIRTNSKKFKFKLDCPIEAITVYNYKKELIVLFSDGVNINSSTPKLLNLHNPQKELNQYHNFTNEDDFNVFELFTPNKLPVSTFTYRPGSLDANVVHVALLYVYEDTTDGLPTPILTTVYPNFKGKNKVKRDVDFTFTNLSPLFTKAKLLFIVEIDGATMAYETPALAIYDNKLKYTLSSVENLNTSVNDKVLLAYERFTKIKTLTKTATQSVIGWTETNESFDFQKYANRLVLDLSVETDPEKYKGHPQFLPDEVYSMKIVPLFLDGSRGNAFHIPGRELTTDEKTPVNDTLLNSFNLNIDRYKNKGYKKFHFVNTGSAILGQALWGGWENEETYPDNPMYNSSDIGGENLIGKNVRYHRFPSPQSISLSGKQLHPTVANEIKEDIDTLPRFVISVKNFDAVVPQSVKDKLQGYEIVFEKRSKGGSYIEFVGLAYTKQVPKSVTINYNTAASGDSTDFNTGHDPLDFTEFNFLNNEVAKERVEVTASLVKLYKGFKPSTPSIIDKRSDNVNVYGEPTVAATLKSNTEFASIVDTEYKLANNIASGNRFGEERLFVKTKTSATDEKFKPFSTADESFNLVHCALITLNKNLYNLDHNTDFISAGKVIFNSEGIGINTLVNGDVFATNVILKSFSSIYSTYSKNDIPISMFAYLSYYVYNIYSPLSNHYITNGTTKNKIANATKLWGVVVWSYTKSVYKSWSTEDVNILNNESYTTVVKNENSKYFNDLEGTLSHYLTLNYVNKFPYRVYKGLSIPNESLNTSNLRVFLTNQYYEMPNDKGEIIALRGFNNGLFIQLRYSLFRTSISDKLNSDISQVYLGNTELFDRLPEELISNNNLGYIGSNSQFACIVIKEGYVTVDEEKGKVFLVDNSVNEISQQYVKNDFRYRLPLKNTYLKTDLLGKKVKVDNPFTSIGYIVGYDEEYSRLLITKKSYTPTNLPSGTVFNGEHYINNNNIIDYNSAFFTDESFTYSYALDSKTWVSPHDYTPNVYYSNNDGMFAIVNSIGKNAELHKHNSKDVKPGHFYGKRYESFVDLIFNTRLDINKQYQAMSWVSEAINIYDDSVDQFDTIDKVMLYNHHQCSGLIPVSKTGLVNSRNVEGIWNLNEFRDMLKDADTKFLDDEGNIIPNTIKDKKQWYNKNIFIANFIVTRLVWDNISDNHVYIHNVNVKSVTSQR